MTRATHACRLQSFLLQNQTKATQGKQFAWLLLLLSFFAALPAIGQTVSFNAPFASLSQSSVTFGQGIVSDASSNLYITGTTCIFPATPMAPTPRPPPKSTV